MPSPHMIKSAAAAFGGNPMGSPLMHGHRGVIGAGGPAANSAAIDPRSLVSVQGAGVVPGSSSHARTQTRKGAVDPQIAAAPSPSVLEQVDGAGSKYFMGDMIMRMGVPMATGFLSMPFALASKLPFGGNFSERMVQRFDRFGKTAAAPIEVMEATTLSNAASGLSESIGRGVGKLPGISADGATVSAINNFSSKAAAVEARIGESVMPQLDKVATVVGDNRLVGAAQHRIGTPLANRLEKQIPEHFKAFSEDVQKMRSAVDAGKSSLGAAFQKDTMLLDKHVARLEKHVAAGVEGFNPGVASLHMRGVDKAFNNMGESLSKMKLPKDQAKPVAEAIASARAPLMGNQKLFGLFGQAGATKKIETLSSKIAGAATMSNLSGSIKEIPQTLANTSLHTAAFNTAISAGMAVSGVSIAKDVKSQMHALERMCASVEGKKSASATHVLLGDVPDVVKLARGQMIRNFGPELVLEAVADVANFRLMGAGHGMLAMAGLILPQMAKPLIAPANQLLPVYHAAEETLKTGQKLGPDEYAALISAAVPEVAKAGGINNGLVFKIGESYAQEQTTPAALIKEVQSGEFKERTARINKQLAETGRKAGDASPVGEAKIADMQTQGGVKAMQQEAAAAATPASAAPATIAQAPQPSPAAPSAIAQSMPISAVQSSTPSAKISDAAYMQPVQSAQIQAGMGG